MRKILILLFFIGFTTSCIVQGWTNDFETLSESQKNRVKAIENFRNLNKEFIYKINGQQLKEELKNRSKSIVYIFANGCTSDYCKPISVYEDFALRNGYSLFLIMAGYTNLNETLKQPISNLLFVIDNDYYNERLNYKYYRYFKNDLLNKPLQEKQREYRGNLYFFKGDSLVQILRELPKE